MSSNHGRRYLGSKIQDGSQLTGSTYISETMTYTINIPTNTAFDHGKLIGSVSNNDRQSETVADTWNTYVSETVKSTVKIPTTHLGHKCKIVSASKYNIDRQPEVSIWQPKTEILRNFSAEFGIFDDVQLERRLDKWLRQRSTIRNSMIGEQNVYIAISGCRSLSQSSGVSFFVDRRRGRKPHICCWNCHPICHRCKYFRFLWPHCHFRLSVLVAITWRHFIWARHGQKSRTCCWNFDAICCSSGGITTSGFGGHIAISGCRSMFALVDTFCELAVVENLRFAVGIVVISFILSEI